MTITVDPAGPDAGVPDVGNLLELYLHDLSDVFPIELGPDGRFGYQDFPATGRSPTAGSRSSSGRIGILWASCW